MHTCPPRDGTDFSVAQYPPVGLPRSLRTVYGRAGKEFSPICSCHWPFHVDGMERERYRGKAFPVWVRLQTQTFIHPVK